MPSDTTSRELNRWERESGRRGRSEDFFRQQEVEREDAKRAREGRETLKSMGREEPADVGEATKFHRAGVQQALLEIRRLKRLTATVRVNGGLRLKYGSPAYIETTQLAPARGRLEWHRSKLDKIRRNKRRLQLRKARQAYEARHPERANRFEKLRGGP